MYNNIYERIKSLCKENDITFIQLEKDLGIKITTMKNWKTGHAPAADKILQIATYFNVSTDYLLGVTETRQRAIEFNDDIITLQRAYNRLSPIDRKRMIDIVKIGFHKAFEEDNN